MYHVHMYYLDRGTVGSPNVQYNSIDSFDLFMGQDFYHTYLIENDYKVTRFHELAQKKGLPHNLATQALAKKQARLVEKTLSSLTGYKIDGRSTGTYDWPMISKVLGQLAVCPILPANKILRTSHESYGKLVVVCRCVDVRACGEFKCLAGTMHLYLREPCFHWQ